MSSRGRQSLLTAVAASLASALCLGGVTTPAHADPAAVAQARAQAHRASDAVAKARAELDRLDAEVSRIQEDHAQAKLAVQQSQREVDALTADIAARQKLVNALTAQIRDLARADFQQQGLDITTKIFVTGDPGSFLRGISTAAKLDENMNAMVRRHEVELASLDDLRRTADIELAKRAEIRARLSELATHATAKAAEATAVLGRLSEDERKALAEQERRETEELQRQAAVAEGAAAAGRAAAAGGRGQTPSVPATSTPASVVPPGNTPGLGSMVTRDAAASERAKAAAAYAKSQVGDSYVWAAEGPEAFDCSGLTLKAYRAAGVALPHSSLVQSGMGTPVAREDLRPGDLLFWYAPVHHVGIYVGDGMFVHARNVRVGVVIQPLDSYPAPFSGARRVAG